MNAFVLFNEQLRLAATDQSNRFVAYKADSNADSFTSMKVTCAVKLDMGSKLHKKNSSILVSEACMGRIMLTPEIFIRWFNIHVESSSPQRTENETDQRRAERAAPSADRRNATRCATASSTTQSTASICMDAGATARSQTDARWPATTTPVNPSTDSPTASALLSTECPTQPANFLHVWQYIHGRPRK